jgi:hypothetical protein
MKLVEIMTRLRQPVPKSLISTRKQGGTTIEFISWSEYADLLASNASAMALRRACAMAGLSRQLWQK